MAEKSRAPMRVFIVFVVVLLNIMLVDLPPAIGFGFLVGFLTWPAFAWLEGVVRRRS